MVCEGQNPTHSIRSLLKMNEDLIYFHYFF